MNADPCGSGSTALEKVLFFPYRENEELKSKLQGGRSLLPNIGVHTPPTSKIKKASSKKRVTIAVERYKVTYGILYLDTTPRRCGIWKQRFSRHRYLHTVISVSDPNLDF